MCTACNEVVTNGAFHWRVESVEVLEKRPPPQVPVGGSGGGPEHGLQFPTVFAPGFAVARREFVLRHPEFSFDVFKARVTDMVHALNQAWSSKKWEKARPYETDHLFDRHRFWIERYKQNGLTNVCKDITVKKVEACKLERDAFFDLITVRVYVDMIDYTVRDADGAVVDGSNKVPRQFSEYWTLMRRAGFSPPPKAAEAAQSKGCPSCAAPLQINVTGECEFCGALVTSGQFDWVLAAIDQDEDYAG
jgi:hypothetical protein